MIKAVMFDLDGTLLPIDENAFVKGYLSLIGDYMTKFGYDKKELINDILAWTKLMTTNDGSKTNYDVFWGEFEKKYSKAKLDDIPKFNEFYVTEFKKTISFCNPSQTSKKIIEFCKNHNIKTILATNPFFPKIAILTRLSFINLDEEDFDYITSYENSSYSKISPNYYKQILDKLNLNSNEVLMFGNNEIEDIKNASQTGIKSFLVSQNDTSDPETITLEEIIQTIIVEIIKSEI